MTKIPVYETGAIPVGGDFWYPVIADRAGLKWVYPKPLRGGVELNEALLEVERAGAVSAELWRMVQPGR